MDLIHELTDDEDFVELIEILIFPRMPQQFRETGSLLQVAGDLVGIDKSTASRAIKKVSNAIAGKARNFIMMPQSDEDIANTKQDFLIFPNFLDV